MMMMDVWSICIDIDIGGTLTYINKEIFNLDMIRKNHY